MRLQLVAVKDRATETHNVPLAFKHINEAIRWFTWLIKEAPTNNENAMMKSNPDDYDLWHIGNYDDETAKLENLVAPQKIADGKTVANSERE